MFCLYSPFPGVRQRSRPVNEPIAIRSRTRRRAYSSVFERFRQASNSDEAHLVLARDLPSVAGVFLDSDGVAHVALSPEATEAEKQLAADFAGLVAEREAPVRRAHELPRPREVRVDEVKFGFVQLAKYRDMLLPYLNPEHVTAIDVDERTNHVMVGAAREDSVTFVLGLLEEAGVPKEAVEVQVLPAVQEAADTLRSEIRPVRGGMQIRSAIGICTLGYSVMHQTRGEVGFVTNSHCTNTRGGTEGTIFGQPSFGFLGLSRIGEEQLDPFSSMTFPGCPPGRLCRRSDSAYASFDAPAQTRQGHIAKPIQPCTLPVTHCMLDLPSSSSEIRIVGLAGFPMMGDTIDKIGRTTGWTYGQVSRTCVTLEVRDSTYSLICQDQVAGGVDFGDSGSPTFRNLGGDTAQASGLLWATSDDSSEFTYSSLAEVMGELGSMDVVAP